MRLSRRNRDNLTFPINKQLLSGGAVITDRDALQAIATAFKHLKIVIEPGGAAALAAVLTGQYPQGATRLLRLPLAAILMRKCFGGRWMKARFFEQNCGAFI